MNGRWLLGAVSLVAAATFAGAAYQSVATARDRLRHPPPGRLVDTGGHRLHLNVMGEHERGPTVVLELCGTASSPPWARIQPGIAEYARVVSYDRAGLGWSEPGPKPRDAFTIARELHAALENAGIGGPYVLVGGSMGGPFALAFAGLYPEDTAGVVLVDSMHPDQWERVPARIGRAIRLADRVIGWLPILARLGLLRLFDPTRMFYIGLSPEQRLPPEQQAQLRVHFASPGHWGDRLRRGLPLGGDERADALRPGPPRQAPDGAHRHRKPCLPGDGEAVA